MHITASTKIKTLQVLRAVAVLLVVHSHLIDRQPGHAWQAHFFYLQNYGSVGVDIFFVISGFIITIVSRHYAQKGQAGLFFLKRAIRVIPVYWLVSLFVIIHYLLNDPAHLPAAPVLWKTFLFFPFFDKTIFTEPIIFIGWTLSFEMLFYLVVAISMRVSSKRYIIITILFFIATITIQYFSRSSKSMLVFLGNPIILEFLLGIGGGLLYLRREKPGPALFGVMLVTGAGWLLATIFTGYHDISQASLTMEGQLSLWRVFIWGIPSALLVTGAAILERKTRLPVSSFWVNMGNASYSIYLIHIPFLQALYMRWDRWGISTWIWPDMLIIIMLVLILLAGYIFYSFIERPLLHWLQKQLIPKKIT